jgi:FixJ family two-component response regulator
MQMRVEQALDTVRGRLPKSTGGALDNRPLVIIVDDDEAVREALAELMQSAGLETECFESPRELLTSNALESPGCLVLDVRMPGSSGLDLQTHLAKNGNPKPIVFLTGHGDIPMTVQAMKAGAINFLTKPVRDQTLLDAVIAAIEKDTILRAEAIVVKRNVDLVGTLTTRERQVLSRVAHGRLNKQIAFDLGISEVTVKLHRSNMMRKLKLRSVSELVRVWETLPVAVRDIRVA